MTTRVEGLKSIASATGETFVTVENYARVLTALQVPAPYNTTLGRGKRHARLRAEWLCSTFLSLVLGDPKHAPQQVPACGNLRLSDSRRVSHKVLIKNDGGGIAFYGPRMGRLFEEFDSSVKEALGETLFDALVLLVTAVARDWDGTIHQMLRLGFELTITVGSNPSAELTFERSDFSNDTEQWTRCKYTSEMNTEAETDRVSAPIRRQALIKCEHIELLAALYAGTLKHEGVPPRGTPPTTASESAEADAEQKNAGSLPGEPAPSDCQLSAPATSDDSTHTQANGLDNRGCNPGVCVSSSGKSVRAGSATSNRRRQHALASHHHAFA